VPGQNQDFYLFLLHPAGILCPCRRLELFFLAISLQFAYFFGMAISLRLTPPRVIQTIHRAVPGRHSDVWNDFFPLPLFPRWRCLKSLRRETSRGVTGLVMHFLTDTLFLPLPWNNLAYGLWWLWGADQVPPPKGVTTLPLFSSPRTSFPAAVALAHTLFHTWPAYIHAFDKM